MIYHLDGQTEVQLSHDDFKTIEWEGPFEDFCASNKFDDGEMEELEYYLSNEGQFVDGGGAMAGFRLRIVNPKEIGPYRQPTEFDN